MTVNEMQYHFEVGLDTISSHTSPGYVEEEIDIFLNRAQDLIVEELFNEGKTNLLRDIITWESNDATDFSAHSTLPYAYRLDIFTNPKFLYYLSSIIKCTRTKIPVISTQDWVECDLIDAVDTEKFITTSQNLPLFFRPKILMEDNSGSKFVILFDSYTTIGTGSDIFRIQMIRRPIRIYEGSYTWNNYWNDDPYGDPGAAQNCELDINLHAKIVSKAVDIAKVVEDPKEAATYVPLTENIIENDSSRTTTRV